MNVPRRAASSPGLMQMKSDLAADAKRAEHAAITEQWSDVTMRPDLYQQPVQRKSASEARDPLPSSGSGQPMPEDDVSLDGAIGMPYSPGPVQTECGECGGAKAGTGECPACKAVQAAATPSAAPQVVQRQCDPEIASCPLEEPGASPSPNALLEPNASPSSSPPNMSVEPNQTTGPRYPNQTCTNEVLDALQAAMHAACDIGQSTCNPSKISQKKLDRLTCDEVNLRLQRNRACLNARIAIQTQCFGGTPDQRHADQIEAARRSLEHCEILWNRNCRQQEREQPVPVPVPSYQRVLDVLLTLGLSIALVGVVIAALADPEPASKVALAVGSAALALIILQRLGIEPEEGFEA